MDIRPLGIIIGLSKSWLSTIAGLACYLFVLRSLLNRIYQKVLIGFLVLLVTAVPHYKIDQLLSCPRSREGSPRGIKIFVFSCQVELGVALQNFISFHLFADNIAIYKADTVFLGCRSPAGLTWCLSKK